MTAIFILAGIAVVIIGTIVLVTVPVTHAEVVARGFPWRKSVHIGARVWVKKKSKRRPKPSADVRSVEVHNADDPKKIRYTYEQRLWRDMRSVHASGRGQENVRDPEYTLAGNEEVRRRTELYEAEFVSGEGGRYCAKVRVAQWRLLTEGAKYRLGRNSFGYVRTIKPAKPAVRRD